MWKDEDGSEVLPLSSTESRVNLSLQAASEVEGGKAVSISFDDFETNWVPKFEKRNIRLGPNWAGENLSGTSFGALELFDRVRGTAGF